MTDSLKRTGEASSLELQLKKTINNKRIAVVGLGNTLRGDDGFGIKVAESLKIEFPHRIFIENEGLDEIIDSIKRREEFKFIVFVDTVEANEKTGTLLIVKKEDIEDIKSSHKIPLSLYLSLIEKPSCIIGIQPEQCNFMQPVSEDIEKGIKKTVRILTSMIKSN